MIIPNTKWRNGFSPDESHEMEEFTSKSKALVVYHSMVLKLNKNMILSRMGVTPAQLYRILREFKYKKEIIKSSIAKKEKEGRKIKKKHIDFLSSKVASLRGKHFTLATLKNLLLEEFPLLQNISESTICKVMKSNLKMSYKKLGAANIKNMQPGNTSRILQWKRIIEWFLQESYYLVYVDEFTINHKTLNHYGWTPKGSSGWKYHQSQKFSMSFVVGMSCNQLEGIIGFKKSIDSRKFILFLKGVQRKLKIAFEGVNQKLWIIWDNWSIHKSEKVKKFLNEAQIVMIWIVPYSPFLNPTEHLIQAIKQKVKRDHDNGK